MSKPNDLEYRPFDVDLQWAADHKPDGCLVIGSLDDKLISRLTALGCELKWTSGGTFLSLVHDGLYLVEQAGRWVAVAVTGGLDARAPDVGVYRRTDAGHLVIAKAIAESMWADARSLAEGSAFQVDDLVRPIGTSDIGRVVRVTRTREGFDYLVTIDGHVSHLTEESLEKVAGDPQDPAFWMAQPPGSASEVALTLTWTKLRHPLTDTLYSYASSKTVFRAYQFKPVLKLLNSSSGRILIADEVGLGKTIEAGLIWSELEQRMTLQRVLVICPAALTRKWRAEMERRFDRRLDPMKPMELRERLLASPDSEVHAVVSLESLRTSAEVLSDLSADVPKLDLVIVDEAHYMRNSTTKAYALGRLLSEWTDYLIFLSATPLNLGEDDLFNLVNLLDEASFSDRHVFLSQLEPNEVLNDVARSLAGEGRQRPRRLARRLAEIRSLQLGGAVSERPDFDVLMRMLNIDHPLGSADVARAKSLIADLSTLGSVLTRTRKMDVPDAKAMRVARIIDVQWTEPEREFYDAVYDQCMEWARERGTPPGFLMQMPLRQAASSIPAMQALLREKQSSYEGLEEVEDIDDEPDQSDGPLSLRVDLTTPLQVDTKFDRLHEELLRARQAGLQQFMIFSFFRRTLTYLAGRLREGFTCRVMHGGTPMAERDQIMDDFRAGKFEVLLVSEVGSEGLDFEFCNVLINYDLPWNPMRVEQRIGRLDRFGQQSEKIFIYNMHVPGTIETDIFERLYNRIHIFERSIGELEPILRDELSDVAKEILDPALTSQQRAAKVDRLAVAVENRAQQLEKLQESRAILSGIDQLVVEGLTDQGPSDGRYVGPREIRGILERLFLMSDGSLSAVDKNGVASLVGGQEIAARLRGAVVPRRGSKYTTTALAADLRDGVRIPVTFDTEVASKHDVELLSSRHPLVHLALHELEGESLSLRRFGRVSLRGLAIDRTVLFAVDLVETTGLRNTTDLWATAIDIRTYEIDGLLGDSVLAALSEGTLADTDVPVPSNLPELYDRIRSAVASRHRAEESTRRRDNVALVEGRIAAQQRSVQLKIDNAQELIKRLESGGAGESVIRMHRGRLRNLEVTVKDIDARLRPRAALSMRITPVAVILAAGAG